MKLEPDRALELNNNQYDDECRNKKVFVILCSSFLINIIVNRCITIILYYNNVHINYKWLQKSSISICRLKAHLPHLKET